MGYKEFYETNVLGHKVEKGFEIHHIDLNRENNNLSNLVMLPIELHRKYHKLLSKVVTPKYKIDFIIEMCILNGYSVDNSSKINLLKELNDCILESQKWIILRNESAIKLRKLNGIDL